VLTAKVHVLLPVLTAKVHVLLPVLTAKVHVLLPGQGLVWGGTEGVGAMDASEVERLLERSLGSQGAASGPNEGEGAAGKRRRSLSKDQCFWVPDPENCYLPARKVNEDEVRRQPLTW
jgi:hypothetical protein